MLSEESAPPSASSSGRCRGTEEKPEPGVVDAHEPLAEWERDLLEEPKKADEPAQDLALEMGDVLFVLLALANEQKIDMADAFGRTLEKYRVRDADRWTRS